MTTPDERLAVLEFRLGEAEKKIAAMQVQIAHGVGNGGGATAGGGRVASDSDLDGQFGDPVVKKDPKRWTGPSFAGCRMSECSPAYLDEVASLCDWMADRDDEQGKTWTNPKKPGATPMPASKFKREEAARARGWAKRLRASGSQPRQQAAAANEFGGDGISTGTDDEIPFVATSERAPRHLRRRRLWERF